MNTCKYLRDVLTMFARNTGVKSRFCTITGPIGRTQEIIVGRIQADVPVHWGRGGPTYIQSRKEIWMYSPEAALNHNGLGMLAHEYGHFLQDRDGHHWARRRPGSYFNTETTGAILIEELDATRRGIKFLLEEDVLHPAMIWKLVLSFGTYLAGMAATYLDKRYRDQCKKNNEFYFEEA